MTRSDFVFSCVLIGQPKGYTALCTDLDVASEGDSPHAAKHMLKEAVELYLDSALENNLPYLRPVPRDEDPRFTNPETIIDRFILHADLALRVHA